MTLEKRLDTLTIRGFQSIRALDRFPLNNLNVLIGPNGAGKSNFINAFSMLREMAEQRLQLWISRQGGADRVLTFGTRYTSEMQVELNFDDVIYTFKLQPSADGRLVFAEERYKVSGTGVLVEDDNVLIADDGHLLVDEDFITEEMGRGHDEARIKTQGGNAAKEIRRVLGSYRVYHFHETGIHARLKQPQALQDVLSLRDDGLNIAPYLYHLQQNSADIYNLIVDTIRLVLPYFDDFSLKPYSTDRGEDLVRLDWRQKGQDYIFLPNQLSDGALRFISLATVLLQPHPPSTLIIDELELGLHPYAITLLGALIRSAADRMQIIISTQSLQLLNEFSIDDLIVVELDDGFSVFKRLNEADFLAWLEDYTVGELWEKNVLGGRP